MSNSTHNIQYELLVKNLLGEASPAEQQALEQMRRQYPEVEEAHAAMQVIWDESQAIQKISIVDENLAWQNFQNKIEQETPVVVKPRFNWYVAAIWIFAFSSLTALAYQYVFSSREVYQSGLTAYTATLPDASEITLNKETTVNFTSTPLSKERKVYLKGDAYFKVKKAAKPFTIYVNDAVVTVIGTSFYINGTNKQTTVEVETGIVQVIHQKDTVLLHAGDLLRFDAATAAPIITKSKGKLYSYFVSGEIFCDNTPLRDLIVVLEKQFNTKFLFTDNRLAAVAITAVFDKMNLNNIIRIIEETLDVRFIEYENYFLIRESLPDEAASKKNRSNSSTIDDALTDKTGQSESASAVPNVAQPSDSIIKEN